MSDKTGTQRFNPPAQSSLTYRAGSYATFLERMLANIGTQRLVNQHGQIRFPLSRLNIASHNDLPLAFMRAWALLGDVITFYQERIANEGFLRTATERLSILELVQTLGYRPHPGVAASTHLAFTVFDAKGAPNRVVIPAGTQVRSIPHQAQIPPVFESDKTFEARPRWNVLEPWLKTSTVRQRVARGSTHLNVEGLVTTIKVGQRLLIVHSLENNDAIEFIHQIRSITAVEPVRLGGYTTVHWDKPLKGPEFAINRSGSTHVEVYSMRQKAFLLGHNASGRNEPHGADAGGGVYASDDRGGSWQPKCGGLPLGPVRTLAYNSRGWLFAGTADGVFRSEDDGKSWHLSSSGLIHKDVYALVAVDGKYLLAGTVQGGIYRSIDAGATWERIRGRPKNGIISLFSRQRSLPATVVRTLAVSTSKDHSCRLLAGTDNGLFCSADNGQSWRQARSGICSGNTNLVVHTLTVGTNNELYIGTSNGAYISPQVGNWWSSIEFKRQTSQAPFWKRALTHGICVRAILSYAPKDTRTRYLLIGTDQGLYRMASSRRRWIPCQHGWQRASINFPEASKQVNCLVVCTDAWTGKEYLLAGTDNGILRSDDYGKSWNALDTEPNIYGEDRESTPGSAILETGVKAGAHRLIGRTIQALVAGKDGKLFAGTSRDNFIERDWPGIAINGDEINLDRVYPPIVKDSWMVLEQDTPLRLSKCYKVNDVFAVPQNVLKRDSVVSRIVTTGDGNLSKFAARQTQVYADSKRLHLHEKHITHFGYLSGSKIKLAGAVDKFEPGRAISVSGKRASARIVRRPGGLLCREASGWAEFGLTGHHIQTLLVQDSTRGYAGTRKNGIFSIQNKFWVNEKTVPASCDVRALTQDQRGGIYAGTHSHGVLHLHETNGEWQTVSTGIPNVPVLVLVTDSRGIVYAGTRGRGVFRWNPGESHWEEVGKGLPDHDVNALFVDAQNSIVYAGISCGVYRCQDGKTWTAAGATLNGIDIRVLVGDKQARIFAGTAGRGVFCSLDRGAHWQAINEGLTERDVRSLAIAPDSMLYAGTHGSGVFSSSDAGQTWCRELTGVANDVRTLAIDPDGSVIAGTADAFMLSSIDSAKQIGLKPKYRLSVKDTLKTELNQGRVPAELSKQLHQIGISLNKTVSVAVETVDKQWVVQHNDLALLTIYASDGALHVLDPLVLEIESTSKCPAGSGTAPITWSLLTKQGFSGDATLGPGDIIPCPADASNKTTGEIVYVASAQHSAESEYTILSIADPLSGIYDASATTLCANVVSATHGETVDEDVLGTGDASKAHQEFLLKRPPLTYVSAATPSGVKSTLTVEVNSSFSATPIQSIGEQSPEHVEEGRRWHEVSTLHASKHDSRHYRLHIDHEGRTTIGFGDGTRGARLPSGIDNIVAKYRTGLGEAGNLDAGSKMVSSQHQWVKRVTNPVPATGGAERESMALARTRAPLSVRALDRIVSLRDYEDFALNFGGIGLARAQILWNGSTDIVHLTVAASDGHPILSNSELYQSLCAAIEKYRLSPRPFRLATFQVCWFQLRASIRVHSDVNAASVKSTLLEFLAERYNSMAQGFGDNVAGSEVTTLMQRVPGVVAVDLQTLHRTDHFRSLESFLACATARWDAEHNSIEHAERLLLDPDCGTNITVGSVL